MILLLDNYDSFTYNLYQYLGELGAEVEVVRNDATSPEEIIAAKPSGIVISPGPCTPNDAGISLGLIGALETTAPQIPLLGVCLGHQCMAQHFGATVDRAPTVMHGKLSQIQHDGLGVFANLPSPFTATRYHSLIAIKSTVPDSLAVTAWTNDDLVMGLRHKTLPYHGVQFHPESILSPDGKRLLANFLRITGLDVAEPDRVEIDWPMTVQ